VNLFVALEAVASQQSDLIAFQAQGEGGFRRLTFGELAGQARLLAGALVRAGLARGDRVGLISENRPEWSVAYFGIVAAGGVAVPLDVQLGDSEVANLLGHAECRLAIVSGKQADRPLWKGEGGRAPVLLVDLDGAAAAEGRLSLPLILRDVGTERHVPLPPVAEEDLASILYTSGTTGVPKGVMLTHGNFLANVRSVQEFGLIKAGDNGLGVLPAHHAFPFTVHLIVLLSGAQITLPASLKGADLVACMRETGVSVLVAVPQLFYMLRRGILEQIDRRPLAVRSLLRGLLWLAGGLRPYRINLGALVFRTIHRRFGGRLRILASGGARLDPAVARDFLALGFGMTEGYGLTEAAPVVCFNPLGRMHPGSVGVPLPGVEVKILDPGPDGAGEILVRGANVMQGYYRNPGATAEALREGWLHTGDLGHLDGDGYLTITGRAKEVIVLSSGKNVYPEEVEEQYLKSAFIKEICLISQTTERGGAAAEELLALVLPDLDYFRARGMTNVHETIRWDMENVGRALMPHQRPTGLVIVKEGFPRTRLGKIQRHLVAQRYRAEGARQSEPTQAGEQPDAAFPDDAVGRKVAEYLRQVTRHPAVRLADHLELDLGLDSLARVEMLAALEQALALHIPDEVAAECFTVRDVVEHLRALASEGTGQPAPGRRRGWGEILAAPPAPEVRAVIDASGGLTSRALTAFSRTICVIGFRTAYRLRVEGREHVPPRGPFILVANHTSFFDAFLLAASLPRALSREVFYMGFEEFFRHPALAWYGRGVHVIPVDVDSYLVRALQASALVLKEGKILCVFPEGERSQDGRLRPFRKGVGILVRELGVPVLPAHITGAFEAWPRGQRFPGLHPLRVRFGPLVTVDALVAPAAPRVRDEYEAIAARLHQRVAALGGGDGGSGVRDQERAVERRDERAKGQ
jgi:long-chain acyl-CoA synthetase